MEVWEAVGSGTSAGAICFDRYEHITGERDIFLLHRTCIVEQIVWRIAATGEAVLDEAGGSAIRLLLAGDDAVLGVASVGSARVPAAEAHVAVAGVVSELRLVRRITEARGITVAVILYVCQGWVATAYQLVGAVVTIGSCLAIDGHAGAIAIFAGIVVRRGYTATILCAKAVAVGVAADCHACQATSFVVGVGFIDTEFGTILDIPARIAIDRITKRRAAAEGIGIAIFTTEYVAGDSAQLSPAGY